MCGLSNSRSSTTCLGWGSGSSGVVANIYLAERMASAERKPITGVWEQSPQWGPGAEPLVGGKKGKAPLKLKRFYVFDMPWKQQPCLTTLCFGNWVNHCYSWYLSKTGAIAAVESRCKATLFTRSKTFRVEQHQYKGWTDTAGSKETEFTISLCVVPYRATRSPGVYVILVY